MPGINRTGQPNTQDILLGRGSLWFANLNATTGKPEHFRHLGNAPGFSLNLETETLEHLNSRSGVRAVDREVILSQKIGVSVTLDEINFDNLALFLSGAVAKDQTQSARTTTTTNKLLHADAVKGREYELRDASENRLYDLSPTTAHLVVKSGSGAVGAAATLAEGTDYTVDRRWGTVFILSTGAHVDGDNLWFTYTSQGSEKLIDIVTMLTASKISGFLRFKGINPVNSDKQFLVDLHSVSLKAEGDLSLIGEEFSELVLTGVAEKNELGYASAPVGRAYYHTDA